MKKIEEFTFRANPCTVCIVHSFILSMSCDQIPLKARSTLASSISVNIHLAHPGHMQNGNIRLSQQDDVKICNFHVCATSAPSPGNYLPKRESSIDKYWKSEYTNIVYWIYLC